MFKKLDEINRRMEKVANIFSILLIFHLLFVFTIYYSIKFKFDNPLIPKDIGFQVFEPYVEKGLILTIGLLITTILKFFKQNLIIILISMLVILVYYFTNFEPNFDEYQK